MLNQGADQDDNITSMGANEFVHGVGVQPNNGGRPQFLHNNTTGGFAIHPDGTANCQKGQQGYAYGLNRFRPSGYDAYRRAVVDQPKPDESIDFGSTHKTFDRQGRGSGRNAPRVPAGETFTQTPGGNADQLPSGGRDNLVEKP